MKKILSVLCLLMVGVSCYCEEIKVTSPNGKLVLAFNLENGQAFYKVSCGDVLAVEASPLGFKANIGDFSTNLKFEGSEESQIDETYELKTIKRKENHYVANRLRVRLLNGKGQRFSIVFQVSDRDVAFRYELQRYGDTGSVRIMDEATGFRFPEGTTTFLCPQSDAMIGWKRSKPSYEEEYRFDAPMDEKSQYGHGYTFPCLFKVDGGKAWVMVSETGVDSRYCGCRLSDCKGEGLYKLEFPMAEENNGNGTVEPAFSLPGATPWRTLTIGENLHPIVETTVPFDVVEPRYKSRHNYQYGKGTWSWIVWQDNSINYDDQVRFIDLAYAMGYKYVLIDAAWDVNIGKDCIEQLVKYAKSKDVGVFLWYSSSGYWNDITQSPINLMDSNIPRKQWMRWMEEIGVKGIKVDFFGGDKQETIRLYEQILSDADDYGLMVIFHGCTLPRGWERMYPNYVGSEAVLASENLIFSQHFCDVETQNASLHPFLRNSVGCMEFGGSFLNRRLSKGNKGGNVRRTTDCAELALAVLYQNPIQNFALTPENLMPVAEDGAPEWSLHFMREVPTTWEDTRFIDGYPGKYVVLARKSESKWYIAGINGTGAPLKLKIDLSEFIKKGEMVEWYSDNMKDQDPHYEGAKKITKPATVSIEMDKDGGFVIVR